MSNNTNEVFAVGDVRKSLAVAFNNQGHAKYLEVDFDAAVADYTKALELDSTLAVAYYNRGTIRYRLGEYEDALLDLERAVSLEATNEDFKEALHACVRMLETSWNIVTSDHLSRVA